MMSVLYQVFAIIIIKTCVQISRQKCSHGRTSTSADSGLTPPISGLQHTPADMKHGIPSDSQENSSTQTGKPAKDLRKPAPK